jgi:hypothetical protein
MNWKLLLFGGLAYYGITWIVSFITGPVIHEGVLDEVYRANAQFWRPELNQDPRDMAALIPLWVLNGLVGAFIIAFLYQWVRPALSGKGWMRGAKFGVGLTLFGSALMLGWSGVFNLPPMIWSWWAFEQLFYFTLGCAALGWVGDKLGVTD